MKEKIDEFLKRLIELPGEILDLQNELIEESDRLQKIESDIYELESEIKIHILNAIDDSGKKIHTNAELRENAFHEDAKEDSHLQEKYSDRIQIQRKIQRLKASIENLNNYQKNVRIIVDYMSSQLDN